MPCRIWLRYGPGHTAHWAGTVTGPAQPAGTIVHTGPGVYSVIPADNLRPWLIALLAVGVLILAVMTALLRRRRQPVRHAVR